MKNILLFFSVSRIGGAESNFIKIATELSKSGYKINLIIVDNNGPLIEKLKPVLNDYVIIDIRKPFGLIKSVKRYRHFVVSNKIDIVLNFGLKVEIFSRIFSKIFGVKKVISNIRSTDDWRKAYHTFLDRITQCGVDLWISNSQAGADAFIKRENIDKSRTKIIYNYIDDFSPKMDTIDIQTNVKYTIGILSNIKNGKGFEDIVEVIDILLRKQFANFSIKIGGRDLTNGEIASLYEKNNLITYINFVGYVDDKDAFFKDVDVFLLPTYWEGFPTSVLEAMYFGKPVISTNVGGIPEMIKHNFNGYLCKPGDASEIASAIIDICHSNQLYNKLRVNSFEVLNKNFTRSKIIHKWTEVLN